MQHVDEARFKDLEGNPWVPVLRALSHHRTPSSWNPGCAAGAQFRAASLPQRAKLSKRGCQNTQQVQSAQAQALQHIPSSSSKLPTFPFSLPAPASAAFRLLFPFLSYKARLSPLRIPPQMSAGAREYLIFCDSGTCWKYAWRSTGTHLLLGCLSLR